MTTRSKWLIFALVAFAQFMVVLDISITNVALPSIKETLHFQTDSALQWVITAYALTFGGFLLLGGRAADLFGRRLMLLVGMCCFTVFSFLIGVTQSAVLLIALRALQGLAAAMMSPSALSIVLTTFEEGRDRNTALGFWTLVATGGASVGLLLGGALTQFLGWRWNFFINVPIGIVVAILILLIVPKHESEAEDKHLDWPGALLSTAGLIALVFAVSQAPVWGWFAWQTLAIALFSVVLLACFLWNESRHPHALMPLSLFRIQNVIGANLMMVTLYACMLGQFFLISLYLQNVLQFDPVLTGFAFLPFPIVLGFVSANIPRYVSKYGYRRFLIMGPLIVGASVLWLARIPVDGFYWVDLFPTLLVMPIGVGITFMPIVAAATSGVPADEAGLASGLINTSQQMGGALGLAILSGIATSFTAAAASAQTAAMVTGIDRAFIAAVVFMVVAFLIALFAIKQRGQLGKVQVALH